MKYKVILSAKAMKMLDRLDRKTEQRLQARFDQLAANPLDPRLSSKLQTVSGLYYSRVGDWRIIYGVREAGQTGKSLGGHLGASGIFQSPEQGSILVMTVQHRSCVYKELPK